MTIKCPNCKERFTDIERPDKGTEVACEECGYSWVYSPSDIEFLRKIGGIIFGIGFICAIPALLWGLEDQRGSKDNTSETFQNSIEVSAQSHKIRQKTFSNVDKSAMLQCTEWTKNQWERWFKKHDYKVEKWPGAEKGVIVASKNHVEVEVHLDKKGFYRVWPMYVGRTANKDYMEVLATTISILNEIAPGVRQLYQRISKDKFWHVIEGNWHMRIPDTNYLIGAFGQTKVWIKRAESEDKYYEFPANY